jgi:uncharacterized protein YecE (DUF72 family)
MDARQRLTARVLHHRDSEQVAAVRDEATHFYVGTAGWVVPQLHAAAFTGTGTHLERYARVLSAVEVNSSFYRPHRPETYARWARSVPAAFRFAVKAPKAVSHAPGLAGDAGALSRFTTEIAALGPKLGVVLVQLPPAQEFKLGAARRLLGALRAKISAPIALEPRHPSWGNPAAAALLRGFAVTRVAADPPRWRHADTADGDDALAYFRMHGSPHIYHSDYSPERLAVLQRDLERAAVRGAVWCIFDNTASGRAVGNALTLTANVAAPRC